MSSFQGIIIVGLILEQMLRRASRFKHEAYGIIAPTAADDESTLDLKWRTWTEQESFKR